MCSTIHTPTLESHTEYAVAYILAASCLRALTHQPDLKDWVQIKTLCCQAFSVKICMWTHQKTKAGGKLITGMHLCSTPVWEEIIYLEVCICNPGGHHGKRRQENWICENWIWIGKVGVSPFKEKSLNIYGSFWLNALRMLLSCDLQLVEKNHRFICSVGAHSNCLCCWYNKLIPTASDKVRVSAVSANMLQKVWAVAGHTHTVLSGHQLSAWCVWDLRSNEATAPC